jgi:hypothetical protein
MWPVLLAAFLSTTLAAAQCQPHNSLSFRSPVTVASGLAATPIFANLTTPRGIAFDSQGSLLVIERGLGVTAFTEHDPSCNGWLRSVVVTNGTLTQGIQVDGNNLYVSSAGQVLRYNYNPSTRSIFGSPTIVIDRIPATGGTYSIHYSYTMLKAGQLIDYYWYRTYHSPNFTVSKPQTNKDPCQFSSSCKYRSYCSRPIVRTLASPHLFPKRIESNTPKLLQWYSPCIWHS